VENLFSFLCTSAAPLHVYAIGEWPVWGVRNGGLARKMDTYFTHSRRLERLALADIDEMRAMGLGYRARYVRAVAEAIVRTRRARFGFSRCAGRPTGMPHAELCRLPGVGAKIADCVCLFSLDKDQAIPVDTHIWQVAVNRYGIRRRSEVAYVGCLQRDCRFSARPVRAVCRVGTAVFVFLRIYFRGCVGRAMSGS